MKMTSNQSKLIVQLGRQQKFTPKVTIDEERLEDIYQILTKIQSKNLMLVELLVFLIEKGFVKNEHKLHYYMDLYDSVRGTSAEDAALGYKSKPEDEDKFTRKKFIKVFKLMAKKFYPADPEGLENNIYKVIASNEHSEDVRLKIDDQVKKMLSRETINLLRSYERELEILFEIYLPQNFNSKMGFSWQEIKYLEKRLPIVAVFRLLWDCEIIPTNISPTHFFQVTSKLIPPLPLLNGNSQKESLFYSMENITTYAKDSVGLKKMKLLEGDIGVNFLEFQILLIRLSIDITKQKNDLTKSCETFLNLIGLKQTIASKGETKGKSNKFEQNVRQYFEQSKKVNKNSLQVQKGETKKKIQEILQVTDQTDESSRHEFNQACATPQDLINVKKSLEDDHLPEMPERVLAQKENDAKYNPQAKHIVIGEQLPKIPEKNKPAAPKKFDKKDEVLNKFKPQSVPKPELSVDHYNQIIKVHRKPRVNTEYPIILMEPVYPADIPNLYLNPKANIYLETTYIHLGERSYEKAFSNCIKARVICQNTKSQVTQFYFLMLEAQIYEAAAKDDMALLNYHKAKELAQNMVNKDVMLKYLAFKGLACSLYHVEEYEYSMRCFLKARELRSHEIELDSVENAVLENNIGCIYMLLNRNNEAAKHFALSHSILDLQLGRFHERAVVVQQNEAKNKKALIEFTPLYRTTWKTFVEKPGVKPAVKAAKKK